MTHEIMFDYTLGHRDVTIFYDECDPTHYEACVGDDMAVLELTKEEDREVWMAVQGHLDHLEYTYDDYLEDMEYDRRAEGDN